MSTWPAKTRVYESHHLDSGVWDNLESRDGDIIIATAYKSGTTWMQQIVAQLIFNGEEPPAPVQDLSMWVDLRVPPLPVKKQIVDGQTNQRFLKTHLPTNALTYHEGTKYIYVARDGRDAFMSLCNHYATGNDAWYETLNESPGLVGGKCPKWDPETMTPSTYFDQWISKGWETHPWEKDGWPFWSLFYNFSSWWSVRNLPNVFFVHFNDLKKDLPGQMRRVAKFLEVSVDEERLPKQVEACTFEHMHANADKVAPLGGAMWNGGAKAFVYKGTNGRWKGVLSSEQLALYTKVSKERMGPAAARWLAKGGPVPYTWTKIAMVGGVAAAAIAITKAMLKK